MRFYLIFMLLFVLLFSCKKDKEVLISEPTPNPISKSVAPDLISPKSSEKYINIKSMLFTWNNVNNAMWYIITIANDSSFSSNSIIDKKVRYVNYYNFMDLSTIKLHGRFFWKVQSFDSVGIASEFSKVNEFSAYYNDEISSEIIKNPVELYCLDPYKNPVVLNWNSFIGIKEYEITQYYRKSILPYSDSSIIDECYLMWASKKSFKVRAKLIDGTYTNSFIVTVNTYDPRIEHIGKYHIYFSKGFNNYSGPAEFIIIDSSYIHLKVNGIIGKYSVIDNFGCPAIKGYYHFLDGRTPSYIVFKERNDTIFVNGGSYESNNEWSAYRAK